MTPPLRAVKDGEKPPVKRSKKKTVAEAASSGDYYELLVATRDRIASAITSPDCHPRDLAALTRRLTDIGKELEAIDARLAEEAEAMGADTPDEGWEAI